METRIILVRVKSVARLPVSPSTVPFPHQPEPFHPTRQTTVPSSEAKAPIFHADYILWKLWKECQISVVVFLALAASKRPMHASETREATSMYRSG
jgi:hypothetical protein